MPDLIYLGKDVQSFQKSERYSGYDRVVLNLDDNNYVSSPSVSVVDASKWSQRDNGEYQFTYNPANDRWRTPFNTDANTAALTQNYGITPYYSDVTSPKDGDVITVTKSTVNDVYTVTAEITRSGSTLTAICPLVKPSDRQKVADNLLRQVYLFEYQPFSANGAYMNPAAEIGDAINAYSIYSGLFEQETIFNRLMLSNIGSAINDEAEAEMQYETNTDRRYNRKLAQTSAEFAILADRISSTVTNEQFQSAMTTMANQIDAKVSESGGNTNTFAWSLDANGFYLYANGSQVFKCDRSGITVVGDAVITGEVYASNIKSDAVNGYGGSFNGAGITGNSIETAQCASGIVQSLGYADIFNAATVRGTQAYPTYFTAGSLYGTSSVASMTFSVENASGEERYHLNDHYHSFTEQNGKIIIGIPHNDISIDRRSFNIADTQTYRDGVAAITITQRTIMSQDIYSTADITLPFPTARLYESGDYLHGCAQLKNANGDVVKTIGVQIPKTASGVTFNDAWGLTTNSGNYTDYNFPVSFASSSLYTSGSTQYARLQVQLSDGSYTTVRVGIPVSGSSTVSRFTLNGNPGWRSYPTIGTANNYYIDVGVKALDANGNSMGTGVLRFEVTDLLVEAAQWGAENWGGCKGHVEITSTSGNSAFVKIYDSSWNAVPIGSSSVGKWITAGTSETFGS